MRHASASERSAGTHVADATPPSAPHARQGKRTHRGARAGRLTRLRRAETISHKLFAVLPLVGEWARRQRRAVGPLRVLILYPGPDHSESLASVLRGRGHHAERYEYLDDPVRQDLDRIDLRVHIIRSVERGEWDAVVVQPPCSSFSAAQAPDVRTLREPGGTAEAMPHWRPHPGGGNSHAQFTAAVCATAAQVRTTRVKTGTLFMVAHPPVRSRGTEYCASEANHATLWDQPCMCRLVQDVPTSTVTFDQGAFGSPFQKLTTVMASGRAAPVLAVLRRACTHTTHTEMALDKASPKSARYPTALNMALANVIEEVCMQ